MKSKEKDLNKDNLNKAIEYVFKNEKEIINNLKKEEKLKSSTIIVEEIEKK